MDYNNNYNYNNYNNYNYPQPLRSAGPQPNTLVFGILSLVFGCTCIASFVGIILGAIGRGKGNNYVQQGGALTGASKVGFILCKAGLIVSIIMTVIFAVIIIWAIADPRGYVRFFDDFLDLYDFY